MQSTRKSKGLKIEDIESNTIIFWGNKHVPSMYYALYSSTLKYIS